MSQHAGELFVKVRPDSSGFASDLRRQIGGQSSSVQGLLARTGLDKSLTGSAKLREEAAKETDRLRQAEDAAALSAKKLGTQHDAVAVHAHRASIAGISLRGSTLGFGAAALVGVEGLHSLAEALKVTGEEADTTTGRLKNAAAAAISGDFATAAKNLGEQAAFDTIPGARTQAGAAAAASKTDQQRQAAIALAATLLDLREKTAKAEDTVGTAAGRTRFQLEKQLAAANAAYSALAPNLQRVAAGQFGLNADLSNKAKAAPTDASRASDFGLAGLRAAQTKQLNDDRRLFEDRQKFLKSQIGYLENAGAHTQAAKDRLAALYGQLSSVEDQIQTLDDQAAQKRQQRLQARLAADQTNLQIQAANARTDSQEAAAIQADAAFARESAKNRNLDAQTRLGYLLQAAQDDKTLYENQKAAAEQAAADAKAAAAAAKQAREEAARKAKEEIDARRQAYRDDISLTEQKLSINVQRAQLTGKSLKDDRAAIKAQIRFYREQEKDFKLTDQERLNFRSQRIGAQLSLQSLGKGNEAPRSSASDFFKEAASQFRSYGSNITSSSGGILSGQDARASFARDALTNSTQRAEQTRTSQLTEAQKQTALLTTIANRLTYAGAERDPPGKAIGKARRTAKIVGG